MTARAEILSRIRAAHRHAPPPDLAYEQVSRDYPRDVGRPRTELLSILVSRLVDYRAAVRQTTTGGLAATVAAALSEAGAGVVLAPSGLPDDWLAESTIEVLRDTSAARLGNDELGAVDGVITACRVAIAETGTVILDGADDQGRRAITLLPDYHLCIVFADQVVPDVPEALRRLDPTRPLTMISGPSATSDIELSRVEGVHGPRRLEVILVSPSSAASPADSRPLVRTE